MRSLLTIFFALNIVLLNAQVEQKESIEESSAKSTCSQTLKGEVREKITTDMLPGAEVVLSDANGNVLETQIIKEDGAFSFEIKCETAYKLEGRKVDFTSESTTFTTTKEADKVLKLIILLDTGEIDFVTDTRANKAKEIEVVNREAIKEEITPDIVPNEIDAIKPEDTKEEVTPDVVPKPVIPLSRDKFTLKIDPIYFDYESSWLNQNAKNELQKVIDLMKQYPKMVVECAAHTDAKGDVKYNQWMSDRRAQRVIDYIVNKGISNTRISGKGFEEKYIINKCTNDVECTDEERAANRRVEFVIIKM